MNWMDGQELEETRLQSGEKAELENSMVYSSEQNSSPFQQTALNNQVLLTEADLLGQDVAQGTVLAELVQYLGLDPRDCKQQQQNKIKAKRARLITHGSRCALQLVTTKQHP